MYNVDLFELFRVEFHDGRLANGAFRVKMFKLSRGVEKWMKGSEKSALLDGKKKGACRYNYYLKPLANKCCGDRQNVKKVHLDQTRRNTREKQ